MVYIAVYAVFAASGWLGRAAQSERTTLGDGNLLLPGRASNIADWTGDTEEPKKGT